MGPLDALRLARYLITNVLEPADVAGGYRHIQPYG